MGKYDSFNRRRRTKPVQMTHPIWRGIGCLMIVLIPVMSFALAVFTLDYAIEQEWPVPRQLIGYARLPDFLYDSSVLVPALNAITSVQHLTGYLAFAFIYMVVLGAFLSFAYAVAYRLVGPPVYGPLDVPPPKGFRAKRYRR